MTDLMPIQTAARLLIVRSREELTFDADDLILYKNSSFSQQTKAYLTELVRDAQRVAFSNYVSNVLIGLSDEGGEAGDVALWLGQGSYGKGSEASILRSLGFPDEWIHTVKSHRVPELVKQMKNPLLDESHFFSVRATGSYVFSFYLGKFQEGWGGLVGVGIWT